MKVALLVSSLSSGGAERVATTLSAAWSSRGDNVTLIPTYSGGGTPFYEVDPRVKLIYLADWMKPSDGAGKQHVKRLLALRSLIRTNSPDVVVSFLSNVNVAALLATAFLKVPCIVCERSDPIQHTVWPLACNLLYRYAAAVTVQTSTVQQSIGRVFGGLRRVEVVPNPLPAEVTRYRSRESPDGRKILLSLGRLSTEKRIAWLIDAFAAISHEFPEWDLYIVGDGPLRAALESQATRTRLSTGRIRFLGRTTEPWAMMERASAFVLTSAFEGFPNALLEAMGVGLPCITTDCPSGPREITREGRDALLVPPDDVAQLQEAMARLMSDAELRAQLGHQARESVTSRYSTEAVLRRWDEVFAAVGVRQPTTAASS